MSLQIPIADSFTVPLARYHFDWEVKTTIRLSEYAGSALRGVFGAALRRVVCMTNLSECLECGLWRTCPYPLVFATPPPPIVNGAVGLAVTPNPYIIEPPPWGSREYLPGESLGFRIVLVGKASAQLALLVLAWQRAMARGVGPGNGTAMLRQVVLEGEEGEAVIFTPEGGIILDHEAIVTVPPWSGERGLSLRFLTPTRIQRGGSPLGPEQLTPRDVLVALMRRVSQMIELHTTQSMPADYALLARLAEGVGAHGRLAWRDWTRRSSRQQRAMTLGGVMGSWTLTGSLEPFWAYLYLGQWLHVGKNATFGLGHYRIGENKL